MKKATILFSAALACLTVTSLSAQPLTQGKITYEVVGATGDEPTSLTVTFSQSKSRWDWKYKEGGITQYVDPAASVFGAERTEKGVKYYNKMSENEKRFFLLPRVKESKNTNEKSTVAGIPTTHFIILLSDTLTGDAHKFDAWLATASPIAVPSFAGMPGKAGLPMDFFMRHEQWMLHLKATKFSKDPVDPKSFTPPTSLPEKQEMAKPDFSNSIEK